MFVKYEKLTDYFNEKINKLECHNDTKAYIGSIFKRYTHTTNDLSRQSITLLYSAARERQDFAGFQSLGDWLFFCASMYPESLNGASMDYYDTIARASYYRCYTLMKRQWKLFEQMADEYPVLVVETRIILK